MNTTTSLIMLLFLVWPLQANGFDIFGVGPNQFEIELITIGNAGNGADSTGDPNPAGAVDYIYRIGKFEVSEQMIDMANAQSIIDGSPLNLTHDNRGSNKPATSLSWIDMTHFANWLNTSTGSVEAYKFDSAGNFLTWDPSDPGYDPNNRFRNTNARYFLPSVDEWYKAAYYDPATNSYFDYPTGSNDTPDGIDFAGDPDFDAVFDDSGFDDHNPTPNDVTDVGRFSPFGTAGQGGNVWEYMETEFDQINDSPTSAREFRGGKWRYSSALELQSTHRGNGQPNDVSSDIGFRIASVASVPEPSGFLVGGFALVGLSLRRRWASN